MINIIGAMQAQIEQLQSALIQKDWELAVARGEVSQ